MTALPRNVPRTVPSSTDPHALPQVRWLRSSYSTGANNCVETARPARGPFAGLLAVRDSKDPEGPALLFSPESWTGFTAALH
ncbi:DUF397 domain-containing protein [Streptomyces sp. DSM 15324]|uniref:DUF397 domain-containing protein n=1 Tax=Streptomyces sp. DSM 15324 TaxID=1739111 RepID=UPI000747B827|nr:DUF397 domain-containing protein [Streptomyces sp. DSM 15324]KUO08367.1 toxin-antitoxin system, toxin component [Streptomyces sp. DSM 15324]